MSVPAKRLSSRHRKTRAAHHALSSLTTTICPQCKQATLPHKACRFCGYYKGRNVFALKQPITKAVEPAVAAK